MDERPIIWTNPALFDLRTILKFYRVRNGNWEYSFKLLKEVRNSLSLLGEFALIGKKIYFHNDVRVLVKGNFSICYRIAKTKITILVFWDNRQDPSKLKKLLS